MVTIKDLEAFFGDGWNRHDVDVLMTFMSDDCVFESTAGPEVCGTRYTGRERVGEAFARVFKIFPDAKFGDAHHFVAGNRGVSEGVFSGTTADGKKGEGNGCDIFPFQSGKIAVKSPYLKNRTAGTPRPSPARVRGPPRPAHPPRPPRPPPGPAPE